jgi:hypothetical protein
MFMMSLTNYLLLFGHHFQARSADLVLLLAMPRLCAGLDCALH